MGAVEIIALVVSVLIVVGAITAVVINKIRGKGSCCGDCANCPYGTGCKDETQKSDKSEPCTVCRTAIKENRDKPADTR